MAQEPTSTFKDIVNFQLSIDEGLFSAALRVCLFYPEEGIPQDAQSPICTPFMQGYSSTSRHYGGTGIGSSTSRCLVDLMGGEIRFVSKRGVGSTFYFTALLMRGDPSSLDSKWRGHKTFIFELKGLGALGIDKRSIRAEVTIYHLQRLGVCVNRASNLQSTCSFISSKLNSR